MLTAEQPPLPPPSSFLPLTPSHVSSWEGCRRERRRLVVVQRGKREGGREATFDVSYCWLLTRGKKNCREDFFLRGR